MITAVILAGGFGTRLRNVVPSLPKPMAPIIGRPFVEYLLDYWIGQGVGKFIMSVGYKREVISEHFGSSYKSVPIVYAIETEPLGTGGALWYAAQDIYEPFLVLNGDTFFAVNLSDLIEFHNSRKSDFTLSLFETTETGRYMGVEIDCTGEILSLKSEKVKSALYVNGGTYLVSPHILSNTAFKKGECFSLEEQLLPNLMEEKYRLFGQRANGLFIDIGIPDDYLRAGCVIGNYRGVA